ncbi:UPF0481 protein At3g47200-like [Ipomoea triloba]|uniref:UPF0481 protein At3g47200-like n=1 Tax=Ipomoea triloba TaxID=35885 RepID=UPI00125D68FC|nr:UPF0481 protein At3g47200-like [Ipomoea triloba]
MSLGASDHRAIQPDNDDIESRIEAETLARMHKQLEDRRSFLQRTTSRRSSVCIYRVPPSLTEVSANTIAPEIVSIGPYHRDRDTVLKFENYKWSFLDYVLSFTRRNGNDLDKIIRSMSDLERSADATLISSADFVEMMILDSCFILGYMYLYTSQEDEPTFSIPIVTRDLLKLENQTPFFILEMMYDLMKTINGDSLELLALKFFNLKLPRRDEEILKSTYTPPYSDQSIQCVTLLQRSGIKIRRVKANSFREINFKKATLQIPSIAINDYTTTLFINCIALERCTPHIRTHFSAYIAFMSCLINSTRDVTLLGQDGIITSFSQDDQDILFLVGIQTVIVILKHIA